MKYRKYDKKLDYTYVLGVTPVIELLEFKPNMVKEVFLSKSLSRKLANQIINLARYRNIKFEFNNYVFDKLAFKENTYALAVMNKYDVNLTENRNHVVLVNPSNMGNLGTIIRSMVAFNFYDLAIIKPASDIFDPKVISSSMGALFRINFKYFNRFETYQSTFSKYNFYAFTPDGTTELSGLKPKLPFGLVFGSEGHGFLATDLKNTQAVYIKQNEDIDSLNLSIAASIAMYCSMSV